jgi:hypothetical protein
MRIKFQADADLHIGSQQAGPKVAPILSSKPADG